jgi:MOSC domain-containing protein YiiM
MRPGAGPEPLYHSHHGNRPPRPAAEGNVTATILSVNVGMPRTVTWAGRAVTSAIWKLPVGGRVTVRGVNLDGDDQADRRVHGGPDKAVYSYAIEDYAWWSERLGGEVGPATFGENLTTEGIDLNACVIGTRWQIGTATLEVAQPRQPCFKLGMRMGDAQFVDQFDDAARPGAYLRIVENGEISAGDAITVGPSPAHGFTIDDLNRAPHDASRETLERMAAITDLPEGWREWARRNLARHYPD